MDGLPLELKQRICSFLHDSPKLLKPIRLVSKQFAAAAAPYLIPRIFLFKHPDSCDEIQKIVQHPVFSKYVTTIAVDVSRLKFPVTFEDWIDYHEDFLKMCPDWLDYKPANIEYDQDGNPDLTTARLMSIWSKATRDFNENLESITQSLKNQYLKHWTEQRSFAMFAKANAKFQARYRATIAEAFETCPRLTNLIVAPPNEHSPIMLKRNSVFHDCLATEESFELPADHRSPEIDLAIVLQLTESSKAGLNSLTIVDFPINCADFSMITSSGSVESLKHIRIGYNQLDCDPKTDFDFGLEKVLRAAQMLETLWIEMPPDLDYEYDADDLLNAINSKHFRDILLHNVVVSEKYMVSFLLRHADSLQQLDLGITLTPGTWFSTFQRISKQMKVLRRVQFASIFEEHYDERVILSPEWCLEARDFILKGEQLSEPHHYPLEMYFRGGHEEPLRNGDLPEKGLWSDYDVHSNVCF